MTEKSFSSWILVFTALLLLQQQASSSSSAANESHWRSSARPSPSPSPSILDSESESRMLLRKLFEKYGGDGLMTFEGFEHLMENIGLGNVEFPDHDVHDHQTRKGFMEFHEDHQHNKTEERHPRPAVAAASDDEKKDARTTGRPSAERAERERKKKRNKKKKKLESNSTELVTERSEDEARIRKKRGWSVVYVEQKCATPMEILRSFDIKYSDGISQEEFGVLCPAIIYQLDQHICHSGHSSCHSTGHAERRAHCDKYHDHANDTAETSADELHSNLASWKTWTYAVVAVTIISLVGLGGVAVIPIMNRIFYNQLLQFLIALAIGTLTGDALMHLLPHAMTPHSHSSDLESSSCLTSSSGSAAEEEHDDDEEKRSVWLGLISLLGIFFFLIMERVLTICTERKKRKKRGAESKGGEREGDPIGLKLCDSSTSQTSPTAEDYVLVLQENAENVSSTEDRRPERFRGSGPMHPDAKEITRPYHDDDDDDDGHSHGHSHGHEVPKSVSSAAWMVIMGDGLHNFTDGLAIGASFANSLAVGLSTTIAVFCHELPHELGDFAVLLKAGMTIRQALVYNVVSSVLCFVGMAIGVSIGKMESTTAWIFAATTGIFLYIALVDMLPQLSSSPDGSSGLRNLVLHCSGLGCGLGAMLLIALYEDKIQLAVVDT